MGNSYAVSRSNALEDYYKILESNTINSNNIQEILKMSNNILAIEYLKSLQILNSNIEPITIKGLVVPIKKIL